MKILNVGCGQQTYGTHFLDLYPQRPDVIKCDVENEPFPFKDEYFDEVYSENLFEHLRNPGRVLAEMLRVLKIGGKLALVTDNASFWAYHLGAKTHYGGYEERAGQTEDRHYALYTAWHLINHFKSLNIKEVKVEYVLDLKKHSTKKLVILLTLILARFWPHLGCPEVKIAGIKK